MPQIRTVGLLMAALIVTVACLMYSFGGLVDAAGASSMSSPMTRSNPTQPQERASESDGPADVHLRVPASTLPLRWWLPWARENATSDALDTFCATVVTVRNLTAQSSITVDVEWCYAGAPFDPIVVASTSIPAGSVAHFASDDEIELEPFLLGAIDADLPEMQGMANVKADDPRIAVGAFLICRDALGKGAAAGKLNALSSIPAYPVGGSLEMFQAAIAGTPSGPSTDTEQ